MYLDYFKLTIDTFSKSLKMWAVYMQSLEQWAFVGLAHWDYKLNQKNTQISICFYSFRAVGSTGVAID